MSDELFFLLVPCLCFGRLVIVGGLPNSRSQLVVQLVEVSVGVLEVQLFYLV